MAWAKLGTASVTGAVANTSWKELDRVTLSGANNTIDTGSFTAKDNIMILSYDLGHASAPSTNGAQQFNSDTGNNYASRHRVNSGGSNTVSSDDTICDTDNIAPTFNIQQFSNIANQEKLVIGQQVIQGTAGAGNAPSRVDNVGKWANTSNQVTSFQLKSDQNFNTGSEIVVLGYDNDEADSGTNFWQELASVTRTDSGSTLESGNFAAKKYLMVEACTIPANNGFKGRLEVGHSNGTMDTGSNYADRYEHDGGSDSTNANHQYTYAYTNHDDAIQHLRMFIFNKSDKEKLMMWWASSGGSSTGAGNAPQRRNGVAKWANTSNQITNIRLNNQVAGGDAASGSFIKVYGAD